MIPLFVLCGLFIFHFIAFTTTLRETIEFIGTSGVRFCWAYNSVEIYVGYHIISLSFLLFVGLILWWLIRAGRQRTYVVVCIAVFVLLIGEEIVGIDTCWQ